MQEELDNIELDDLPSVELDLNFAQKVSLSFLLFGVQHSHASFILQKLLTLVRSPPEEQLNSDLLRLYAHANPGSWRSHLVEALCIINARRVLRKLGLNWEQLRLRYLPHISEISLHVHPMLKALYVICERLTVAQSGRLVLDINEKLARQRNEGDIGEPLRFYDLEYLEIFMLDWLTRRHIRLGDIETIGSDVQLLIEYFKFHDMHQFATLLIQTYNSNASAQEYIKCESDAEPEQPTSVVQPAARSNANASNPIALQSAKRVRQENAGILLIINQQTFHRNVDEEFRHLLPTESLRKREGTDVDKRRLTEVFSALGYSVESHDNVDHLTMLELIRSVCDRSMMRDSLIVCILSHGFEGAVYGCDSIPLSIIDLQWVLCADKNLNETPKLLIIQACQQNEKNKQTRDVNAGRMPVNQLGNMVVAMSTVPGYVALRHSLNGSWFIQTLCETVREHADNDHVLEILTTTIGKVSEKRGDKDQQMVPLLSSTLRQKVFLPARNTVLNK
ncbi:caspase-8 [Drosophila albomicans]|uniref:Caspase-8 n=1 Tax=Drosophila albomicans TaxID=7291 RepID=A0A6P8ZG92_DROAB|nr:caspase-8 [Drosophila albomicans]